MHKLLHICKKFPYPVTDGETVAVRAMARPLAAAGVEVSLLSMNTSKHFFTPAAGSWPSALDYYTTIRMVPVDNRITIGGAIKNLFSRDSYHISRFVSTSFAQALEEWLRAEKFDFILLETIYLAPYIPHIRRCSQARVILRLHNVEFEIWERLAANLPLGLKRWYLTYLASKLKRFELTALPGADLILAITDRDFSVLRTLGWQGRGQVYPVGMEVRNSPVGIDFVSSGACMGFIGSMDWAPNLEGIQWFLNTVWPVVRKNNPSARLAIAGRNTPDWLMESAVPGVQIIGEVEDAAAFMLAHPIQLVPLLSGSGVRVKLLEALAQGCAVVTTSVGLEGIPLVDGVEVLVADTPEAFARHIAFLLANPDFATALAAKGRTKVQQLFEEGALAVRLLASLQEYFPQTAKP